MMRPVVAPDGHTYERAAIRRHFRKKRTSPVTGADLLSTNLVRNFVVQSEVQALLQDSPALAPPELRDARIDADEFEDLVVFLKARPASRTQLLAQQGLMLGEALEDVLRFMHGELPAEPFARGCEALAALVLTSTLKLEQVAAEAHKLWGPERPASDDMYSLCFQIGRAAERLEAAERLAHVPARRHSPLPRQLRQPRSIDWDLNTDNNRPLSTRVLSQSVRSPPAPACGGGTVPPRS